MTELRLLTNKDLKIVNNYLDKNHVESTFLIDGIESYGLQNKTTKKRSGDFYGYFKGNDLKGIFGFMNMGSLACHYEDKGVLNKIILLKTIKSYRPKYIYGVKHIIEPLLKMLEKTISISSYDECHYMMLKKDDFVFYDKKEANIINAKEYEFSKSIDFLIKVEKAFNRNPKTVNELKNKVYDRGHEEEYLYLIEKNKIISQGLIQTITSKINQISGVYTLPSNRGKGHATILVAKLCENIFQRNKIPALIVSKSNDVAINTYKNLGFSHQNDYLMIELKII